MSKAYKIRLNKGDTVIVIAGKYKGKTGKVLQTHPADNKITVEGINVVKKHQKPNREHPQGGIIDTVKPIWVSKVAAFEPVKKQASKIGYTVAKDGTKARKYKLTNKEMK